MIKSTSILLKKFFLKKFQFGPFSQHSPHIWKECNTEDARKNHVSETFVRWSEIYRLPYFDPTKFLIVDPMHCLFLGIAKWIVTRLWIEENRLTTKYLE